MEKKRVGSIVLSTDQGLGYLAKDFYDNGILDVVMVKKHSSREGHPEWFPNRVETISELLDKVDVLLFFETPFEWNIIPEARKRGIKTVLMVMYECTRNPLPYQPDLILSPSQLDQEYYPNSTLIPVPVKQTFRLREKALTFVHNAGNGGLGGRNGTKELLEAMRLVKSPIKLLLRSQIPLPKFKDSRIVDHVGCVNASNLYDEGDVFIFPEKFNGLSLPLQEAFASGMMIMCGDRFPMNAWLPKEPLIPVSFYKKERLAVEFKSAVFDPRQIATTIDEWYGQNITRFSEAGLQYAKENSWEVLGPQYINILNKI